MRIGRKGVDIIIILDDDEPIETNNALEGKTMKASELNAVEEAKWHVANCLRAIDACMDFRQMPTYRRMLADWQARLAYAELTECGYAEMMQA